MQAGQCTAGPILGRSHLHDTHAASGRVGSGHPRGTAGTNQLACPRGFGLPLFSTLDSRSNLSDYTSGHVHAVPRARARARGKATCNSSMSKSIPSATGSRTAPRSRVTTGTQHKSKHEQWHGGIPIFVHVRVHGDRVAPLKRTVQRWPGCCNPIHRDFSFFFLSLFLQNQGGCQFSPSMG